MNIITLRIVLAESNPPIWRQFQVQDNFTLLELHNVIQIVMGWTDSHLHRFEINGRRYTMPLDEMDDDLQEIDESEVLIRDVIKEKRQRFKYLYDYGDSWLHNLIVEEIGLPEPSATCPICLQGAMACPPEDVGSLSGYYSLLNILEDKGHPEHEECMIWSGGDFDPEGFDLEEVNEVLEEFDEYVGGWDEEDEDL